MAVRREQATVLPRLHAPRRFVVARVAAAGLPRRFGLNAPATPLLLALRLARSGRTLAVPADRSATEVLAEAGLGVDTKCSDGLCGVCATRYDAAASGAIEHRDFVLGAKEREQRVILGCSRARDEGGEIVVDL